MSDCRRGILQDVQLVSPLLFSSTYIVGIILSDDDEQYAGTTHAHQFLFFTGHGMNRTSDGLSLPPSEQPRDHQNRQMLSRWVQSQRSLPYHTRETLTTNRARMGTQRNLLKYISLAFLFIFCLHFSFCVLLKTDQPFFSSKINSFLF